MPTQDDALYFMASTRKFFLNTIDCLLEADSDFAAVPGTMTVAQQVAHAALTVDWFLEGAWGAGWDEDFEKAAREVEAVTSLAVGRRKFDEAFARLEKKLRSLDDAALSRPLAPNPFLGERPAYRALEAIADHTAHHRGSLAVMARLRGKTPAMPYVD